MSRKKIEQDQMSEYDPASITEPIPVSAPVPEPSLPTIPVPAPLVKKDTAWSGIEGFEGLESDMLQIPRIKLLQALSPEVLEHGLTAGSFCNSVTSELIGNANKGKEGTSLIVTPIMIAPRSRILFRDLKDGAGVLCKSVDGKYGIGEPGGHCRNCKFSQWTDKEPPECIELLNIFVTIDGSDLPIPLVLSFGKTNIKAGKQFINLIALKQQSPWNFKYRLTSKFTEKDEYRYFTLTVFPSGECRFEDKEKYREMYSLLKTVSYQVDYDDFEDVSAVMETDKAAETHKDVF